MDDADRAQSIDELMLQRAVAAAKPAPGCNEGIHCVACGEEISEGRRRAIQGCDLCVKCQQRLERGMGR
jgi:phage/conjugal plasmid C-4 type zinc finger TraR family protein